MTTDTVIIVVVSYGRPTDIARCLTAVAGLRHTAYEVIVVENAGSTAFAQLSSHLASTGLVRSSVGADPAPLAVPAQAGSVARHTEAVRLSAGGQPVLLVEASSNLGYGGGINVALASLAGRAGWGGVWVLNPDTEPAPDALDAVLAHVAAGGYGLTGSRIVYRETARVQIRGGIWRRWIARGLGIGIDEPADRPVDVAAIERRLDWISGAAMYATRAYIETVGPMDDSYFLYCEDVDWSLRQGAFKLGYAHASVVYHEYGTTIGSSRSASERSPLSIYLTERNKLLLTRRHDPAIYPAVIVLCLLGLAQSYLLRGNPHGFWIGLKGWAAGLRGEVGPPPKGALAA